MDKGQFDQLIAVMNRTETTEWITMIVLILSFVIGAGTLLYARKQLLADHARSRRQLAIEMCSHWSSFISPETASVTRLIERMLPDQCEAIATSGKLSIGIDHKLHLLNILQLRFPDVEMKLTELQKGNMYEIDGQYVLYIRHIAIRYLNMLESILLSWAMGVADPKVIESEFSYLFDEEKGRTAMEGLRKKVGMEGFPAIEQFMKTLRERTKARSDKVVRRSVT